jgi:adenine-specific DNA-methyltransferase
MNNKKQKLELTWIGKNNERTDIEPRILVEVPEKSYGDKNTENMLIHGDNLLALKALEQDYTGRIKCIYIDPPYNTGNAFDFYDDNVEHSKWLSLMKSRLEILRNLLAKDGFFCCQIDDSEGPYLKVLLDEIFGRSNYLTTFFVQVRYSDKTLKQDMDFHKQIEQIHIYRKEYGAKPNLNVKEKSFEKFNYYIKEKSNGKEIELGGKKVILFKDDEYEIIKGDGSEDGLKEIWASGTILDGNSSGRFFRDYLNGRVKDDGLGILYKVYGIGDDKFPYRYFTGPKKEGATKGKYYQGVPLEQLENENFIQTTPIENFYDLAGSFGNCRLEGGVEFRSGKKPEALLQIILKHFSNENDLVLDSFLGSASTIATAHKMHRKWIGIELGDHCYTHCQTRLNAVIDGKDLTGITKSAEWKGGGGYKFYELAPSLLKKDEFDNWVIEPKYDAEMLAEAMAKHEGYKFSPDENNVYKQGYSTEKDFIFTTTQFLSNELLNQIHNKLEEGESLLICATHFEEGVGSAYPNITVKKIPQMLLNRCEFGRAEYNLNIIEESQPEDIEEDFEEEEG